MAFSYTPKNTAPPIEIHVTLGATPANSPPRPFSFAIRTNILAVLKDASVLPAVTNINLVLATFNGVVIAADTPPAMEPHKEASQGRVGDPFKSDTFLFKNSHSGN